MAACLIRWHESLASFRLRAVTLCHCRRVISGSQSWIGTELTIAWVYVTHSYCVIGSNSFTAIRGGITVTSSHRCHLSDSAGFIACTIRLIWTPDTPATDCKIKHQNLLISFCLTCNEYNRWCPEYEVAR